MAISFHNAVFLQSLKFSVLAVEELEELLMRSCGFV